MPVRSLLRLARHTAACALLLVGGLIAASLGACSDDDFGTPRPTQDASVVVSPQDLSAAVDMAIPLDSRVDDLTLPVADGGG